MGPAANRTEARIGRTPRGRYHLGLTPNAIIDAAVELSQGRGIAGWTLRDLAQDLEVAPSVLYHHVGGKEKLRRHVVERVLSTVDFPTTVMPWREWFRAALYPARAELARYPGTAKWLLLHGPVFPSMAPVVDAGVASLQQAGFARDTVPAYTALFNTALMTIAAVDDRLQHEDEAARDYTALMRDLSDSAGPSAGVSLIVRDVMAQFTGSPEAVMAARDGYYRYVLERLMDGLEHSLRGRTAD
ncbi:TetR/AcrR family transcriptional regulator [Actinomadura sp. WMMB 499]|uniref:TetR/AcrR family transcriptional regulator n=1 Tax=Actinomadura sp. WMMB 499 TaxID=1219491 RepID=UPI001246FE4F|nr:TetR family transcriptional regulator [Actinomadura sp. WMMB 499]QFG21378.1 TetR family transcriptional regulator [Actinomadura sp. WMMB 499]